MKHSKKKMTGALFGLLALALVVGTWAFFTSTSSIENEFMTEKYGSKTIEEFTPKQPLEPGKEITKKANVTNIGDYKLVVRIKIDEKWERSGVAFKEIASTGAIDTVVFTTPSTWTATQVNDTDGVVPTTSDEETVVYKKLATTNWTKGSDGYYYYTTMLDAGQSTNNFMESVVMASNADIGVYTDTTYYSITAKTTIEGLISSSASEADIEAAYNWTTTKPIDESTITYIKSDTALEAGKMGYADAQYTLTITTEICQATQEAVDAEWGMTATDLLTIKSAWALPSN